MHTTSEFSNLKHALFGNQVQSNVINDAITTIALNYLKAGGYSHFVTVGDAIENIKSALQKLVSSGFNLTSDDEYFIRLVTGNTSYNNLKSGEPVVINVTQPNQDSPKHLFRINLFGTDAADEVVSLYSTVLNTIEDEYSQKVSDAKSLVSENANASIYQQMADSIYTEVSSCIPSNILNADINKYAKALIAAKPFYSMRG